MGFPPIFLKITKIFQKVCIWATDSLSAGLKPYLYWFLIVKLPTLELLLKQFKMSVIYIMSISLVFSLFLH